MITRAKRPCYSSFCRRIDQDDTFHRNVSLSLHCPRAPLQLLHSSPLVWNVHTNDSATFTSYTHTHTTLHLSPSLYPFHRSTHALIALSRATCQLYLSYDCLSLAPPLFALLSPVERNLTHRLMMMEMMEKKMMKKKKRKCTRNKYHLTIYCVLKEHMDIWLMIEWRSVEWIYDISHLYDDGMTRWTYCDTRYFLEIWWRKWWKRINFIYQLTHCSPPQAFCIAL